MGGKIGLSLYSYGTDIQSGKLTVHEAIEHAASIGVKGIEIVDLQHLPDYPSPQAYKLFELKDYIDSFGMEVCCLDTYLHDLVKTDHKATVDEVVEIAKLKIGWAKILGTDIIRQTYSASKKELSEAIEKALPSMKKYGMKWCIEIHAPISPDEIMDLIEKFDKEWVGVVPDFSCWQSAGLETEATMNSMESFERALSRSYHIHAKAHLFDEKGEEPNTPYEELLTRIKKSSYNGYVAAEYEGWVTQENPLPGKVAVEKHIELIKKYLE